MSMQPPPGFTPPNIHKPPQGKNTVLWVLIGVVVFGGCLCLPIGAALLFPVFAQAKIAAQRTACLSNLRQISVAGAIYASDYNDVFPKATGWGDDFEPYIKNQKVFRCPSVKEGFGYSMNEKCSGAKTTEIKDPKSLVLVFDSANLTWNAHSSTLDLPSPERHGSSNAAYADAHASRIPEGSR